MVEILRPASPTRRSRPAWPCPAFDGLSRKKLIKGPGWRVVPDALPLPPTEQNMDKDIADIEFVTDAFDEDAAGEKNLQTAMDGIREFTDKLVAYRPWIWQDQEIVPLKEGISERSRWAKDYEKKPDLARRRNQIEVKRNGELIAAPQINAGIHVDSLLLLISDMGEDIPDTEEIMARGERPTFGHVFERAIKMTNAVEGTTKTRDFNKRAYAGALALLASYVALAGQADLLEYDKGAIPLLSRTDLGKLPAEVLDEPTFIEDVLWTSGRFSGDIAQIVDKAKAEDLFHTQNTKVTVDRSGKAIKKAKMYPGLSVYQWLNALVQKKSDPIKWGQDRKDPRWDVQPVGHPQRPGGMVFEFRAMKKGLLYTEWKDYALHLFRYIRQVNQQRMDGYKASGRRYKES